MRSIIQAEAFAGFIIPGRAAGSVRTVVAVADTNMAATRIGGTSAARVRIAGVGAVVAVAWAVGCVVFRRPIAVFAVFKITHFFRVSFNFSSKNLFILQDGSIKAHDFGFVIENWEKNTNHNKKVPNHNIGHKIFD